MDYENNDANTRSCHIHAKIRYFVEMAIGLALIAGLFTWLASLASAGFLVMFTLTAMLGWDKFWALPASIALLNGSGRTFGG